MKVAFLGSDAYPRDADGQRDETEATECTVFGMTFTKGQPVDISGLTPEQIHTLGNSRMFRRVEATSPDKPIATPETVMISYTGPKIDDGEIAMLRGQLDDLGIAYHHRAGAAKLQALLASA